MRKSKGVWLDNDSLVYFIAWSGNKLKLVFHVCFGSYYVLNGFCLKDLGWQLGLESLVAYLRLQTIWIHGQRYSLLASFTYYWVKFILIIRAFQILLSPNPKIIINFIVFLKTASWNRHILEVLECVRMANILMRHWERVLRFPHDVV